MKNPCLATVLFLLLFAVPARANVWVFSGSNCTGSYRGYGDANVPSLVGQYYEGTQSLMNDTISSVYIADGFEFWGCRDANYGVCARQVNESDSQYGNSCVNFTASSWQSDQLPVSNEMSSFVVQPHTFESYWDYFGYKERSSDPGSSRIGYVELWDTVGFTGHNYKLYYSDTTLSTKPIGLNTRSLRIYGNMYVQLCANSTCSIVFTVKNKEVRNVAYLGLPTYVYGIRIYESTDGSAMSTIASDFTGQGEALGRAFLNYGPSNRKNFTVDWEYGQSNHRNVWPSQSCYNECNTNGSQGCPTDPSCADACRANVSWFAGMFNEQSIEYLGDVDLVMVTGHGVFTGGPDHVINVTSGDVAWCLSPDVSERRHWANSSVCRRDMGNQNLEWFLTASCQSLGTQSTPWSDAHEAWQQYLDSGVHGIGGFHRDSWWRDYWYDDTGAEIASRFWSDLTTKPVREAWFGLHEYFSGAPDRCSAYMTAEDCMPGLPGCFPSFDRWYYEYYWGYQTGPRPDLRPAPAYLTGEYCP